jgi:hypothetical protein
MELRAKQCKNIKKIAIDSFSLQTTAVSHIEFTRAQFGKRIVPGLAIKQFTSTSCFHFRQEEVTSVQC